MTALLFAISILGATYLAFGLLLFVMAAVAMGQRAGELDPMDIAINFIRLVFLWPFAISLVDSDRPTPGCNCPSCQLKRERIARERGA